jgi:hypothetical protein
MLVFLRSGPCRCRAPPALRPPQFSLTFAPHFYGARHGGEHAFAAETRALLKALPRDHSYVRYSSPRPGDRLAVDLAE